MCWIGGRVCVQGMGSGVVWMGFGSVAVTGPTSRPFAIVTFAHICWEEMGVYGDGNGRRGRREIYREKGLWGIEGEREMGGDNAPGD